jgi:hypothetical protein
MNAYAAPTIVCILVSAAGSPSMAADAPSQLWGKTISASYTSSTPILEDGGKIGSRRTDRLIYISSAGQIFERVNQRSITAPRLPRSAWETRQSLWEFVGGKLVMYSATLSGGADLFEISFDSNFQSCTLSGILGHESGRVRKWTGMDGRVKTAAGPAYVSEESCSISAGNGL